MLFFVKSGILLPRLVARQWAVQWVQPIALLRRCVV